MTQKMYFLCLKPALVVEGASCKVGRPHTATKKKTLRGAETKQRIFNINVIIIVVIFVIIMIMIKRGCRNQTKKKKTFPSFNNKLQKLEDVLWETGRQGR